MGLLDTAASIIPGGDLITAGISGAVDVAEKRKQEEAANRAFQIYQQQIAQEQTRATGGAATAQQRAQEDYAAKMDEFKRSQHLQNLMKREQLAERGITAPAGSSIGQSEWGQVGAEQTAAGKGIESWRARKVADIGTGLVERQQDLLLQESLAREKKEAGQYNWSDVLRQANPAAIAGGIEGAYKAF